MIINLIDYRITRLAYRATRDLALQSSTVPDRAALIAFARAGGPPPRRPFIPRVVEPRR